MATAARPLMPKVQVIEPEVSDPKEYKIPLALVGIGVAIYLGYALVVGGMKGVGVMAFLLPVQLGIRVGLGVLACFITARVMGTAFGYIMPAIVKLAAVFIFPAAVTFFIPWVGWIVALLLYWGLLEWLFELEAMETIVLVIVIFVVNAGAILLLAFLGMAAMA